MCYTNVVDERSLRALEFDKVRAAVAAYAFSPLGARRAEAMTPSAADAPRTLAEAAEMMAFAGAEGDIPLAGLKDVGPLLKRLALEGVLVGAELVQLRDCLLVAARARRSFVGAKYPHLGGYAGALEPLPDLAAETTRQIDDDGVVRDDATPTLAHLRKKINAQKDEILAVLERLIAAPRVRRALREPIYTERNGRYVLPVRTDSMGAVRGIVHAHSSSGNTAFVEPMSLVELNNRLEGLLADEEAEVERILRALSHRCAAEGDALAADVEVLAELDFIAARAGYGLAYRAVVPRITPEPVLELRGARHPLLLASRAADRVVPVDFALGDGYRGMVISGPNNGGKTVALKTAGLLAAMGLAGVPIPVAEGSAVGPFEQIFADIGDESSIEGNLSTFTAHMANVRRFLDAADGRTLVFLDEIGVGTSPKYGVAIAATVLRRLVARGAGVACTTHYDELKTFAEEEPAFVNAAVEADPVTLEPTYILTTGRPGTSEALAILRRLGFPGDVVAGVVTALGAEEISLADLLARLGEREARASALADEVAILKDRYDERLAALDEEKRRYDVHGARLREEAYAEAAKILREARRHANVIIRELKEKADLAAAEEIRRRLLADEQAAAAESERLAAEVPGEPFAGEEIAAGSWVTVRGTKTKGTVSEMDEARGRARVRFGAVDVWVDFTDLAPAAPPARRPGVKTPAGPEVAPSVNLIGKTVEEALMELGPYLERAALARLPSVEIIHGHGTGRLRGAVRQFLRDHPLVASYGAGPGGNEGVTVAHLRP